MQIWKIWYNLDFTNQIEQNLFFFFLSLCGIFKQPYLAISEYNKLYRTSLHIFTNQRF